MQAIVVIAASAGGLTPLVRIIAALSPDCRASVFVVQHIGARHSLLPDILTGRGSFPAAFARHSGTQRTPFPQAFPNLLDAIKRGRGRPLADTRKTAIKLRLNPETVEMF